MADSTAGNFSKWPKIQAGLDKHLKESLGKIQGFVNNSTFSFQRAGRNSKQYATGV